MQEAVGLRAKVSEKERHFIIEALKLLTGFQRQLIEVKHTLETLLKT
jgi:hypothetical protein